MRILEFRSGDRIKVYYKIKEGDKSRVQPYEGLVIAIKGQDLQSKTFTVRKIGNKEIGVERIFPLQSPNIDKIEIMQRGNVRRAKLYYLRDRIGKAALKVRKATPKEEQDTSKTAKKTATPKVKPKPTSKKATSKPKSKSSAQSSANKEDAGK